MLCRILILTLACLPLYAQAVSGTIFGFVRDASDAAIPAAEVTVRNTLTNYSRQAAADSDGAFRFASLPLGLYMLTVEHQGFSQFVQEGITLQVDQQARIDVKLRVGNVSEKVLVTAEAGLINAVNSETSEVVDRQRVEQLPLNGRNFSQLIQLTAGTNSGGTGDTQNNVVINQFRGSTAFTANGMRTRYNNFVLDGVDNNENAWNSGGIVMMPVIDAIQEFKVSTGNFSSEFGRAVGGVVNVQTRSGTNAYHGNLFEFFRNSSLDANEFFNNTAGRAKPDFRQNQFGGTFGGPIWKDKLFFFADYQGTRQRRALTFLASTPPADARLGDFTNTRYGNIFDPATTRVVNGSTTRDAFPGRRIPAARIDPLATQFLQFMPLPNTAPDAIALNFANNPKWSRGGNQGDMRVDYSLGPKGTAFARYSIDRAYQLFPNELTTAQNPFGGGGRSNDLDVTAQNVATNLTYLATPNLVLEGRMGLSRFNFIGLPLGYDLPEAAKVQVPGARISPTARSATTIGITGFTAFGPTTGVPNYSAQTTFQWVFNTTYTRGKSSIKSGVDIRRNRHNNFFVSAQPTGSFSFSPGFTSQTGVSGGGVALATFLLGFPDRIQRGYSGGGVGRRNNEFAAYVQNDYKATDRLTLSLGIRYEIYTPFVEIGNRMSIVDLTTAKIILPSDDGPFGRGLRKTDKNNFAPRAGLAYRTPGASGVVVRAGYGISYIEEFGGNGTNPIQNPPNSFTQDVSYSVTGLPAAKLVDGVPIPGPIDLSKPPSGNYRMLDPHAIAAYAQQWDLSLQKEFRGAWLVDASYVGTKGTNLLQIVDPNQPVPGGGALNPRRPLFAFAPDLTTGVGVSNGNSVYHSLQLKVQKRFSHGFHFLAAYTLSKNLGDIDSHFSNGTPGVASFGSPQNPNNVRAERGLSDTDVPQRIVASYGWELPFFKGRRLLGGWQTSGIVTLSAGNPYDLLFTPVTLNNGFSQRPDRVASGALDNPTIDRYFDLTAFRAPAAFTFGNAGRNILRGPGLHTFDLSVIKDTRLSERLNLQWRTDFFNAFNTPQFNPPGNTLGTAQAGRISSTRFSTNRQIQFVLKLFF